MHMSKQSSVTGCSSFLVCIATLGACEQYWPDEVSPSAVLQDAECFCSYIESYRTFLFHRIMSVLRHYIHYSYDGVETFSYDECNRLSLIHLRFENLKNFQKQGTR